MSSVAFVWVFLESKAICERWKRWRLTANQPQVPARVSRSFKNKSNAHHMPSFLSGPFSCATRFKFNLPTKSAVVVLLSQVVVTHPFTHPPIHPTNLQLHVKRPSFCATYAPLDSHISCTHTHLLAHSHTCYTHARFFWPNVRLRRRPLCHWFGLKAFRGSCPSLRARPSSALPTMDRWNRGVDLAHQIKPRRLVDGFIHRIQVKAESRRLVSDQVVVIVRCLLSNERNFVCTDIKRFTSDPVKSYTK